MKGPYIPPLPDVANILTAFYNKVRIKKMIKSKFRGYDIEEHADGQWYFCGTGEPVVDKYQTMPCGNCGEPGSNHGHDACIKNLPGVMNACCGHGDVRQAYIQFLDGVAIYGYPAKTIQAVMKRALKYHPSRIHDQDEAGEVTDGDK